MLKVFTPKRPGRQIATKIKQSFPKLLLSKFAHTCASHNLSPIEAMSQWPIVSLAHRLRVIQDLLRKYCKVTL